MFFVLYTFLCILSGLMLAMPECTYVFEIFFMSLQSKDIYVVFFWDLMSFFFSVVVLAIASSVVIYSNYYMDADSSRLGFIFLLSSFVVSMLLLLLSPNLITLLLGWDGLGLTSYLLVVYYSSYSSSSAGLLTFLVNRLGDSFFLLSVGAMALMFDWEKATGVFVLGLLLIIALSTKSAQIPFSAWLPAAMAAPTPVSSLVHSSTLVTAGLYLMIRYFVVLSAFSKALLWSGVLTLLAAGLMAFFEWDLKKLIAFSTLSQLGFMVTAYAMGLVWLSFFHLLTHALFKASLFLSAGVLIHSADNSQEFRNMFVVPFQLFWISSVVNICLLCLCGVPFTSGFYSKDLIIDGGGFSFLLFLLYLSGVLFTIIYSSRFFIYSHRVFKIFLVFSDIYEKVKFLFVPLSFMVFLAVWGGWFFFDFLFSFKYVVIISFGWKALYFWLFFLGIWGSFKANKSIHLGYKGNFFFSSIFFMKYLSSSKYWKYMFFTPSLAFMKNDQGVLESLGPQGMYSSLINMGLWVFTAQKFLFLIYFFAFLMVLFLL